MHRRPVGYQARFLEAYQPGASFYLPESLRSQLHEMGRTSADQRPADTYARDILGRLAWRPLSGRVQHTQNAYRIASHIVNQNVVRMHYQLASAGNATSSAQTRMTGQ